jgi:hypothetical protein
MSVGHNERRINKSKSQTAQYILSLRPRIYSDSEKIWLDLNPGTLRESP